VHADARIPDLFEGAVAQTDARSKHVVGGRRFQLAQVAAPSVDGFVIDMIVKDLRVKS
jgi:hypothetical protein